MEIIKDYLTISPFARPGSHLRAVKAIVLHWTANPGVSAKKNRDFFEKRKSGVDGYGSAHYIVGLDGEIICCIPDNEKAIHVGSGLKDPISGKIYTEWARKHFGEYASNPDTSSPNWVTIGIEMCANLQDDLNAATVSRAADLSAELIRKNHLTVDDIATHFQIVGWKLCPRPWVDDPRRFDAFKKMVSERLAAL